MNKILENYYSKLKNHGLLSNYDSYLAFEKFLLDETKSGERITKFHSLLMKSNSVENIARGELFSNLLLSIKVDQELSDKNLIEFIFHSIKSENYLSSYSSTTEFIESLTTNKKINDFCDFLIKIGYDTEKYFFKSIYSGYKKSFGRFIKDIKTKNINNPKEAIALFNANKNQFFPTELFLECERNIYTKYFSVYIKAKIKQHRENLDRLKELQKEAKEISSSCSKDFHGSSLVLIQSEIERLETSLKEEKIIKSSIDEIINLTKKIPSSLYIDNIEDSLLSKDLKKGYHNHIRIGALNYKSKRIPVLFDFYEHGGFTIKKEGNGEKAFALMQNIVFRLLFSLPPGHLKIRIIDEDSGSSFQHLLNLPDDIKGSKAYFDESEVLKLFEESKKRDSNVIFNKLKSSYKNLIDYNKVNVDEFEPIEIYLFSSFPDFIGEQHLKYISNLMSKGFKTGSFYMLALDEKPDLKDDKLKYYENICDLLPEITSNQNEIVYLGKNELLNELDFQLDSEVTLPDYAINQFKDLSIHNTLIDDNNPILEDLSLNTSKGIKVKIGTTEKRKPVYLDISNDSGAYHGLICGTTGSGKSVLLHQIITAGVKQYTPNELQFVLLDYKEGTGFKVYKDLPHARIIAVDADIDFGYESFKFLTNEMKERAKLFKKYDTKDITQFKEKTLKDCSRILVIVDEFQVLLEGKENNYDLNNKIRKAIEDIVRLGRSFGIHLLLATQTPNGVKWSSSTLENIAIRIGLRMSSDAENYLFKHTKPIASEFVERFGKAVYNDRSGVQSKSIVFNVDEVEEDKIHLKVEEAQIDAKKNNCTLKERTVYEGEKYHIIEQPSIENIKWNKKNLNLSVILGKKANISNDYLYWLKDDSTLKPTLILGDHDDVKISIIISLISNFVNNSRDDSRVWIYCGNKIKKDILTDFFAHLSNIEIISERSELLAHIGSIDRHLKKVLKNEKEKIRLLLCLIDTESLGKIGNESIDSNDIRYLKDFFKDYLTTYKSIDLNTAVFCDNVQSLERTLGISNRHFNLGISLQGFNNRVKSDLHTTLELSENQCVFYNQIKDEETKFNVIKFNHG